MMSWLLTTNAHFLCPAPSYCFTTNYSSLPVLQPQAHSRCKILHLLSSLPKTSLTIYQHEPTAAYSSLNTNVTLVLERLCLVSIYIIATSIHSGIRTLLSLHCFTSLQSTYCMLLYFTFVCILFLFLLLEYK